MKDLVERFLALETRIEKLEAQSQERATVEDIEKELQLLTKANRRKG